MATKIPPELFEIIIQKAGGGLGCREIAAWLGAEHDVTVSHMTVARLLQKEGAARADAAKTTARTKLAKSVTTDLDRLELFARKAMRLARQNEHEPEIWVKLADTVRKFTVEKLNRSGVDTPDDSLSDLAAAERRVAGKLALLLAEEDGDLEQSDADGESGT